MEATQLNCLSKHFEQAAKVRFKNSVLYKRLCESITQDCTLLSLVSFTRAGQPASYLLFAVVYYLIMKGISHPLAKIYRNLAAGRKLEDDPFPIFRDFCLQHEEAVRDILSTRLVQTNEVGRTAYLRIGLKQLQKLAGRKKISVIELGASAGLNLSWDQYGLQFLRRQSNGEWIVVWKVGNMESSVLLRCELRGDQNPFGNRLGELEVVERLGIDLAPPDLDSADDVCWLLAQIGPDQPERARRLLAALELACESRWPVIQADATVALNDICATLHRDTLLCIVCSHFLHQLTESSRLQLETQFYKLALKRDFAIIAQEWFNDKVLLTLTRWRGGRSAGEEVLATCESYGEWIEWQVI